MDNFGENPPPAAAGPHTYQRHMQSVSAKRDDRALEALKIFTLREGQSPSLRELAAEAGFKSTSTSMAAVRSLERQGRILRHRGRARAIQLPRDQLTSAVLELGELAVDEGLIHADHPRRAAWMSILNRLRVYSGLPEIEPEPEPHHPHHAW